MQRFIRLTWTAIVLVALAVAPAGAGVVFEVETTDHDASPPRTEETSVSVEGKNIAMDVAPGRRGGGGGKMIFRGDRGENGEVIVTDDGEKSYFVMDDATIRELAGMVGAAMGAMQEALKNMPKEQREAIEKAMKEGRMPGGMGMPGATRSRPEVRNTGERATHGGYPCVKYEVVQDGRKLRELWVTDWSNIEGGGEARVAFEGLAGFFEAMIDSLPELPGGADPFAGIDSYAESFGNGFPVVARSFDESGELEDESVLRSSRRRTLDPAEFEPPAGYKRRSMGPQ